MHVDLSDEDFQKFHHRNCFRLYNRLISVYGDDFSHLELDRVKWGSGSNRGDLLELSLYDIKNSKFLKSEVVSDMELFKSLFINESRRSKSKMDILLSNSKIFDKFSKILETVLLSAISNKSGPSEIRLLLVENKTVLSFLETLGISNMPTINVNFIKDNKNNYLLAIFDRSVTFLSEIQIPLDNINYQKYLNIVSTKESMNWHGAAAFESLWKQSILEAKIKSLSKKMKNDDGQSSNYMRILAHELKNPIQPILGFSDMIQNNARLDSAQKNELLKIISRNARKLDIMTNNILDYARMENNNFKLNYEIFDVIKITEELMGDYSIQINKKKLMLNLVYSTKPLLIKADKLRIIEVLDNLINNSVKFTERGRIDLFIEKLENSVLIEVKDTGSGITKEASNKLFTKFYTTDKLGTGLGLYLSKIIVDKHGGNIEGRNNDNGIGSIFTIKLPL